MFLGGYLCFWDRCRGGPTFFKDQKSRQKDLFKNYDYTVLRRLFSGSVDMVATGELRAELIQTRLQETGGDGPALFDFGGTIEDILARCKAETHLEPPRPPTFAGQAVR